MKKLEAGTIGGLIVAATAITLGLFLEGGRLAQVMQPTAAVIVIGGTLGAVLVQFPFAVVLQAFASMRGAFTVNRVSVRSRMEEILRLAMQARKQGMVSLDPELKKIADPFFRKALMLAIDGMSARDLREIMELELTRLEEEDERAARVWEAAGGFSPTIGILGAVLGLIQVMQQLDNIAEVGRGIAVAFVATLYGVGLANLLFLPLAGKLRLLAQDMTMLREITIEGAACMVEGASPRALRERLGARAGEQAPVPVARMVAR